MDILEIGNLTIIMSSPRLQVTPAQSADAAFQHHSVPEIRAMHRRIQADVQRKDKSLRAMLSSRYRDLLLAANAVSDMNEIAHDIFDTLNISLNDLDLNSASNGRKEISIPSNVLLSYSSTSKSASVFSTVKEDGLVDYSLIIDGSTGVSLNDNKESNEKDSQSIELYRLASLIKLLVDTPEQIYKAIEAGNIFNAAVLSKIFNHVYHLLSQKLINTAKDSNQSLISRFSFIKHQHSVAIQAIEHLISYSQNSIKSNAINSKDLREHILSLCLLSENISNVKPLISSQRVNDFTPLNCMKYYLKCAFQSIISSGIQDYRMKIMENMSNIGEFKFSVDPNKYFTSNEDLKPMNFKNIYSSYLISIFLQISKVLNNVLCVFTNIPIKQIGKTGMNNLPGPKNIDIIFDESDTFPIANSIMNFSLSDLYTEDTDLPLTFKHLPDNIKNFECKLPNINVAISNDENEENLDFNQIHSVLVDWYKALLPRLQKLFEEAVSQVNDSKSLRIVNCELYKFISVFENYFEKLFIILTGKSFNLYIIADHKIIDANSASITDCGGIVGSMLKSKGIEILEKSFQNISSYSLKTMDIFINSLVKSFENPKKFSEKSKNKQKSDTEDILYHLWSNPILGFSNSLKSKSSNENEERSSTGIFIETQIKPSMELSSNILKLIDEAYENGQSLFTKSSSKTVYLSSRSGLPNPVTMDPQSYDKSIPIEAIRLLATTFDTIYEHVQRLLTDLTTSCKEFLETTFANNLDSLDTQSCLKTGLDSYLPWYLVIIAGISQKLAMILYQQRSFILDNKPLDISNSIDGLCMKISELESKFIEIHISALTSFIQNRIKIVCTITYIRYTQIQNEIITLGRAAVGLSEVLHTLSSLSKLPFWVEPDIWDILKQELANLMNALDKTPESIIVNYKKNIVNISGDNQILDNVPSLVDLLKRSASVELLESIGTTTTPNKTKSHATISVGPRFTLLPVNGLPTF